MALTQQRLKELFRYDPEDGRFYRLVRRANKMVGDIAGNVSSESGYRLIGVDGTLYRAHRLAWLYVHGGWPLADIDHINGDRDDNRLRNLREASRGQNLANKRKDSRNKSGLKGASWDRKKMKWVAYIKCERKSRFLGYFKTPEAAHEAYMRAAAELFGEFARAA